MLTDITEELWTGQEVVVSRGTEPSDDTDMYWKEHKFREDSKFRQALLSRMSESGLLRGSNFIYDDTSLSWNVASMGGEGIESFEAELDIQGKAPMYVRNRCVAKNPLHIIVGAELTIEGENQYRLRMFSKTLTERGKSRVDAEQNPELIQQLSEPFQVMYGVLQDMGYLARE